MSDILSAEQKRPESTYETICKQECEWCAKGSSRTENFRGKYHHADELTKFSWKHCTASSCDAVLERLAAERDAAIQRAEVAAENVRWLVDKMDKLQKAADSADALRAGRQAYFDALVSIYAKLSGEASPTRPHMPKILDMISAQAEGIRVLREALSAAQEEFHLIRMKDCDRVYDPTLRFKIATALASTSQPATNSDGALKSENGKRPGDGGALPDGLLVHPLKTAAQPLLPGETVGQFGAARPSGSTLTSNPVAAPSETDQQHISAEVEAARNRIALELHQSYQDIQKTDVARELAQADLELARSQLSVILAQMNEGRASLRQVEEARFMENEKWIAFYDAQFNAERARLNILRQTGELMAALR